ncbi:hypothetical protein ACI1MP_38010 (plasmid) [Kitasatospora griseola]|uniref:hypothetical protein n=1 Tax=Kitasatospora griseola TaxID=2064 RepID=UPI0038556BAA
MSAFLDDPAALDESLEIALGRRAPFTQVGDWVLLSGVCPEALALYWGLSAHISVTRDDNEVWPGLRTLARILQLKKPEQVARYMLQLEIIGAVEVFRSKLGLVRRNKYVVHQTPPASYRGPQSMAIWYAANRAPKDETQEAAKRREAEFDAWLDAVRAALKVECERVAAERVAARKAKKAEPPLRPFVTPELAPFRSAEAPSTALPRTPKNGGTYPQKWGSRTPMDGG